MCVRTSSSISRYIPPLLAPGTTAGTYENVVSTGEGEVNKLTALVVVERGGLIEVVEEVVFSAVGIRVSFGRLAATV